MRLIYLLIIIAAAAATVGILSLKFGGPKPPVCLICRSPDKVWLDFLKTFRHYQPYVVVDEDNDLSALKAKYPTIKFVQISADECRRHGFKNMNYTVNKDCTAWEKAVYYFSKIQPKKQVWFFEDDVFFRSEADLIAIDKRYPSIDLLAEAHAKKESDKDKWHHWTIPDIPVPEPHYHGLCCAIRASDRLLGRIAGVAAKHKRLYFLEILFPTEAHTLTYAEPDELHTIKYNHEHTNFAPGKLYHPLKDIGRHAKIRSQL